MTDATMDVREDRPAAALSTSAVCGWAFVGGLLVVLSDASFFQGDTLAGLLGGPMPHFQMLGFLLSCTAIAVTSVVWALVHRPIFTEKIALQLGIIAPAAISAMLAASTPAHATQDATAMLGQVSNQAAISRVLIQEVDGNDQPGAESDPGPLQCILSGFIRRPC